MSHETGGISGYFEHVGEKSDPDVKGERKLLEEATSKLRCEGFICPLEEF